MTTSQRASMNNPALSDDSRRRLSWLIKLLAAVILLALTLRSNKLSDIVKAHFPGLPRLPLLNTSVTVFIAYVAVVSSGRIVGSFTRFQAMRVRDNDPERADYRRDQLSDSRYARTWEVRLAIVGLCGYYCSQSYTELGVAERAIWRLVADMFLALTVAAGVSLLFDVFYHEEIFGRPLHDVLLSIRQTDKRLRQIVDIVGLTEYRNNLHQAYSTATERIISVSDAWTVDNAWWETGQTEACPLFKYLSASSAKQIIFAGRVPWPTMSPHDGLHTSSVKLHPAEFQRLLGVVWRLNIAHALRHFKYSTEAGRKYELYSVRVVDAAVPITASVVDGSVFALFYRDQPGEPSYGTRLTKGSFERSEDWRVADAYASLLSRYTRHGRSAREFVEAILVLAVMSADHEEVNYDIEHAESGGLGVFETCLVALGMNEWLDWSEKDPEIKPQLSARILKERALDLLSCYRTSYLSDVTKYTDILEDLK